MNHPYRSLALLLGLLLAAWSLAPDVGQSQTTPSSGMRVRSSGTDLGRATIVNCTTGVTCTLSGSVWTLSASGGGSTPTGTGFIHVTAGVQDAAAKLVDTADITNNAVTLGKLATQANLTILANISGGAAVPTASTFTAILDAILGTTQGSVLYRDGSTWTTLGPGTNGQFLQTQGAAANIQWATLAGGGNVSASGTPTNGQIAQWTNATTIQGITLVPVANGGTNLASGTSGGILAYTASGTLASSAALGANLPVIGGGAGVVPSTGTRSGNTTAFVTTTGTQTSGDCVKIDANGNHIANGSACGGGSSVVSVSALASDATANATTTGVKITGLDTATGTGTFFFQYVLRYQGATAGTGVKFGINHTGTTTVYMATMRYQSVTGSIIAATQANASGTPVQHASASARAFATTAPNMGPTTSVDTTNTDLMMIIEGLVVVTVTGNLELWHASEAATSTQVMANSSLILTKTQ